MARTSAHAYVKHRAKNAKRRGFLVPEKERAAGKRAPLWLKDQRSSERFGEDTEHRGIEAFASGDVPAWFLAIRPATQQEDQPGGYRTGVAGVDMWVSTDRGEIPVQVKSSAARAAQYRAAHPDGDIAIVVLHREMSDEQIRERVLAGVVRVWAARASTGKRRTA